MAALVDPLAVDVVGPVIGRLTGQSRTRAESILDRWAQEPDPWLRRAALLTPVRELRAGSGDGDGFVRRARAAVAYDDDGIVREGLAVVRGELARSRPGLVSAL